MPKILVSRKISDLAEEKLKKEFDVTLNLKDQPIPESELIKIINEYDGMISTGFDKIGRKCVQSKMRNLLFNSFFNYFLNSIKASFMTFVTSVFIF